MSREISKIKKYVRAANYLTVAQIYLQDNFLVDRKLTLGDIKPRLLGHWGTCPGINFIYANLNNLIKKTGAEMAFVLGPGHGFPALQANLFIEKTLVEYYPEAKQTETGIGYIAKNFSWPYGFPSHTNPGTPGAIIEGGELGYALASAYGLVLDNPNLIATCVIGDGEAETGPTATAWHLNKFINPKNDGMVLPILHLNEYKISGPTIFGRMTNKELKNLFRGYGYEPYFVEGDGNKVYKRMVKILEKSYHQIKKIQKLGRREGREIKYRPWPMIILKTPKGWTGIKELNGEKIEGNFLAHQVPAKNAKENEVELLAVEKWLKSYHFNELFGKKSGFIGDILSLVPEGDLRMGKNKHTFGKRKSDNDRNDLLLPLATRFLKNISGPGLVNESSMLMLGKFLKEVALLNIEQKNFRLFSPDETYSNKLAEIFQVEKRTFMLPLKPWDKDLSSNGRVLEILSEHSLQGVMQGYTLSGRYGVFASYEAFIQIVSSMADQYAKFLKMAQDFPWRGKVPSFNYVLSSSGWRQEHNGFSHQNPGFIDSMLQKHSCAVKVFFPPDANAIILVMEKCFSSYNGINIIVAGKTDEPIWLDPKLAEETVAERIKIWDFASEVNPDIVFSAAGDYVTKETLAAIDLLKQEAPEIKSRFVSLVELSAMGFGNNLCSSAIDFEKYFTSDKPVIFNFHGYPETLKQVLFDYQNQKDRFSVHGYIENGSTTTPFDMHLRNQTSRYHLIIETLGKMSQAKVIDAYKAVNLIEKYQRKITEHREYIITYGVDPLEIEKWQWKKNI